MGMPVMNGASRWLDASAVLLASSAAAVQTAGKSGRVVIEAKDLRFRYGDEPLIEAIHRAIAAKPKGHDFLIGRGAAVSRHMNVTGG